MVIVKVKENLNFRRKRNRYPEAPTRPDNTRRSIALRQYVNISALQLLAFARQRGEMPGKVPGEARRRPQIIENMILDRPRKCHFFDPQATKTSSSFPSVLMLISISKYISKQLLYRRPWENYQILKPESLNV